MMSGMVTMPNYVVPTQHHIDSAWLRAMFSTKIPNHSEYSCIASTTLTKNGEPFAEKASGYRRSNLIWRSAPHTKHRFTAGFLCLFAFGCAGTHLPTFKPP